MKSSVSLNNRQDETCKKLLTMSEIWRLKILPYKVTLGSDVVSKHPERLYS